jgi:GAF domain-containing protein
MSTLELLQSIAERLREQTSVGRVTVRLRGDGRYPLVAEALAPGVRSLVGFTVTPSQRTTLEALETSRTILVQHDVTTAEITPPRELLAHYGVKAQLLVPVVVEGELMAIVSVHELDGPRCWSSSEIGAAESAAKSVQMLISRA